MRSRRAVVTGGAGFLGSHLCQALLGQDHPVVCVDDFTDGNVRNVSHLATRPDFELVRRDLTQPFWVPGRVGYVFHFPSSGALHPPGERLYRTSQGTRRALELAENKEARFILATSADGEARRSSQALTSAFHHSRRLDTAIARIFDAYGPRMCADDSIPTFIRQATTGEPLTFTGDGMLSPCYVDDTVHGLMALAESSEGGPVDLGGADEISLADLARLIVDLTGSSAGLEREGRSPRGPKSRRPDLTAARSELGWSQRVAIEYGLRMTIEWFSRELVLLRSA